MTADREPGHRDPWPTGSDRDEDPLDVSGPDDRPEPPDAGRLAWLIVGALAIAGGTAHGWDADSLTGIVTPPPLIRAALIGLAIGTALVLLLGALNRIAGEPASAGRPGSGPARPRSAASPRDIGAMIRGVRLVFLAVAALAAASGWLIGHPLPLVVALVIAGVDVLETSFLLIVVGLRTGR
jgi:hypothetical protein